MQLGGVLLPAIMAIVSFVVLLMFTGIILNGICQTSPGGIVYGLPNPPLNLLANAVATDQINLSWATPTGGGAPTGYKIEYSFDGETWNTFVADTGTTSTSYNATGLIPITTYYFRVSSINPSGTSLPSEIASGVTFGAPSPPTNLSYNSPSPTEIDLSWVAPTNNGGTAIVGYKVERAFPPTSNPASFSTLVANTGNVTTWHDTSGITSGTTFSYRVSTLNNVATSSPTAPINATSDPPAASNSTGSVITGIAVCPSTSKLLSLNTTNANGSMIIIAPTQFLTTSTGTKSVNVYLKQNATLVAHNQMSIRLGSVNTENMYTTLFYNSNAPNHAAYEIDACTTAGSVNAIAKIVSIFGKTNVSYVNGTVTTLGGTDTTLASTSLSSTSGNNVILANLGIQSLSASTGHFTIDSFKIKNTAGSTISSNKLGLDIGGSAPSSTMYTLLVGGETSASGSQTYTITGLRPNVTFNARVEMLVFSVPQLSFSNAASTFVGLAATPLATLSTTLASNASALAISSTIYNNTSTSPVNIPANHNYITNGSTIASNSFLLTPFANGGSFGDSFISELVGVVSNSGSNPTFTTNADANITGTNSATQAIAFQLSGAAATVPTNLKTPTQNSSAIKLTWTAPSTNGGFPITGYTVMQDSGSGFVKKAQIGNVTTYTVNGLTSGSKYAYKVAALNALGNSTFSTPSQNYTITSAPTGLKANTFNSTRIDLSWTAPSGYKNGYKIYRESPTGNGFAVLVANTTNTSVTYTNNGLTTGTQYNYKVSAINTGGFSQNSTSVANFTTNTSIFMTNGAGVQVTSVCSSYTNILNVTGTSGSNLVFVNGQFTSNSAVTKQVGFKVVDSVSGAVLANNKTSIRLNTAGTWNSYMLIGSESSSPSNPVFQVFACTSGNSILAKARVIVINGYSNYLTTTGATTLAHYYDVNKQIASIATTSAFSTGPNVLVANIGIVGNGSASIRIPIGAIKIMNGVTDLSDNRGPIYVGQSAPSSSPSLTLLAIDNSPGTTPTYTVNVNVGNNTNTQASLAVLHVSSAFFADGTQQTLAADPSLTTLNTVSTTFPSGATVATFTSSLFNNTATSIKQIPAADYQLKRGTTLITNNTMAMRSFNPTIGWGDTFNGAHVYVESLSSGSPSYSVLAAANQSSSIQGNAKLLTFCLTCASPPSAPSGLSATEFNATQTNLSWTAPTSNGGSAITGYEIDRQFNGSGSFVNIKSNFGNVTSYNDNTRQSGYPYAYQVKAINAGGTGAASNIAKITPILLAIFTPSSTAADDTIFNKHMTNADYGINTFSVGRLENYPTFHKDKLYCSFTSNSTQAPYCATNQTNFHGTTVTFVNKLSGSKTVADYDKVHFPPMDALIYDPEPNNLDLTSPFWETGYDVNNPSDTHWNTDCPKPNKNFANNCAAYYNNQGAASVHSYGYLYGIAPTGSIVASGAGKVTNSTYQYCIDAVVYKGLFDTTCGLLWNGMNGTNFANVDYLIVQSQGWINNSNQAQVINEVTKLVNYVRTNSTGHTQIILETNLDTKGPAATVLSNLLAVKNLINGTNDVCSQCNATALDNFWTQLKR